MTAQLEKIANSPTPGAIAPIATLTTAITTTPAQGTVETQWTFSAAPPSGLQGAANQFRVQIDAEIILASYSAGTWSLTRGAEGSTPAAHANGASVFHYLTAGALMAAFAALGIDPATGQPAVGGVGGAPLLTSVQNATSLAAGIPPQPAFGIESWINSSAYGISGGVVNANGVLTAANISWPDGATGAYAATAIDSTTGAVTACTYTYVWTNAGGGSHGFTETITIDPSTGAAIATLITETS